MKCRGCWGPGWPRFDAWEGSHSPLPAPSFEWCSCGPRTGMQVVGALAVSSSHSHPAAILKNSVFSNKTCHNLSSILWYSLFSQVQIPSAVYLKPVSIFKDLTREHFLAKLILILYPHPCTYALILSKRVLWKTPILNPNDLFVNSLETKKLVFPH